MIDRHSEPAAKEKSRTASNSHLDIVPAQSDDELKKFLLLPWSLYRDDPNWIPPLLLERSEHLSKRNPYFLHADFRAWIALREGKPVGRISAQVDRLHLELYSDRTGFFGMIEAQDDPDVFKALFDAASKWLREQGIHRVQGPFNLSINDEVGLLVEGFDTPPMMMMGHARPYYSSRIEEQGFTGVQDLLAYRIRHDFAAPSHMDALIKRVADRVCMRVPDKSTFSKDLAIIKDIFADAWSENWGFQPFTTEEFEDLGKSLRLLVPLDYVRIAEVDGEPAAMMVLFPNLNEAVRDLNGRLLPFGWIKLLWRLKVAGVKTGRVPLMGVRKRFQGSRLGATLALMMITELQRSGQSRGMEDVEMSWILEGNKGVRSIIESIGGVPYKRYRIYQKELV
jgi:hypothetical protein